jgi:opacity protein-like surface antigen
MKKISLLIVAFGILALNVQAGPPQLQKGTLYFGTSSSIAIGGSQDSRPLSLGFVKTNYKTDGETTSSYSSFVYNIMPRTGIFVMDNLVTGLEFLITGYSENESDTDYSSGQSTLGVGPWARFYYPLEKIYPFVEGSILFGQYKDSYGEGSDWKEFMLSLGLSAGVAFPVGDHVTFDAMIGYSRTSYQPTADGSESYNSVCSGFGAGMGISIYLSCLNGLFNK